MTTTHDLLLLGLKAEESGLFFEALRNYGEAYRRCNIEDVDRLC